MGTKYQMILSLRHEVAISTHKKILELYGQVTEILGICRSLLLIKPEAKLRKQNRIKTIHSSLAVEGNSLTIDYVTALMDSARIVGHKKDILEVQNAIV